MNAPEMNFRPKGLYIGGEWVSSTGNKTFETINPSNSQGLGEVPYAIEEDVDFVGHNAVLRKFFSKRGQIGGKRKNWHVT